MARTVIDLDEDMVAEAMRIYGSKTKAKAVRLAMEDAVKRHLRQEFFDAMDAGELDFSEIVDSTGGATIVSGDPGDTFRDSVHYLRSGYTMYYALPESGPGTERRLQVELTPEASKRLPNVRIRARSGYIVPGQRAAEQPAK